MRPWLILISLMLSSGFALAAPVALVEEVSPHVKTVQPFDFLSTGDVIQLGDEGQVLLGYLNSCVREEISGGQVQIGDDQSSIQNGNLLSRTVEPCNGTNLALAANEATQSGATAFRVVGEDTEPEVTLNYLSPVILVSGAAKVTIKRVDAIGERIRYRPENPEIRSELDLAADNHQLTAGATYMVSGGGRSMIFKVSEGASADNKNYLGRLLIL